MSEVDFTREGAWKALWPRALVLTDHLEDQISNAFWTFGGGTVLMLRIAHRQSKGIDLFVPDPQYLGYINPRLSEVAENISSDYGEAAEYIKLYLREGEIDVVAGHRSLMNLLNGWNIKGVASGWKRLQKSLPRRCGIVGTEPKPEICSICVRSLLHSRPRSTRRRLS